MRVCGIEWQVLPNGVHMPFLYAEDKMISCESAKWVIDNRVNIGADLEITEDNKIKIIVPSINKQVPAMCIMCGSALVWESSHLICNHFECPSKPYNSIIRLAALSQPLTSTELVLQWKKKFIYKDEPVFIENAIHLINMLKLIPKPHYTTGFRALELKKHFGEAIGNFMSNLELNVIERLEKGFTSAEFWYIANLPFVTISMSELDPGTLVLNDSSFIMLRDKFGVPAVESIVSNEKYWKDLYNGFQSFYIPRETQQNHLQS